MNLEGLPYTLASMRLEDVPTVSEIEQIVFTLPWSVNAFNYELRNNPASEYLVLRYEPWVNASPRKTGLFEPVRRLLKAPQTDSSLLGYGGFWMMLEEAHICTLAVRPEWRGRGLGELLLVALIEHALQRQAEVVTLEARVSNVRAHNLYQKYGFKTIGRRKGYYSDNGEDAFVMSTDVVIAPAYQQNLDRLRTQLRARLEAQPNLPPGMEKGAATSESALSPN
jgi:[ribosomal protein S18]-alanine N-acetyltransferase